MEDLKAGDFVVTEDGVPQTLSVFELQKPQTLNVSPKLDGTAAFHAVATAGVSSYYVLGYYTTDVKVDGSYRKTTVAIKDDTTAKLDYRAGYYANNQGRDLFGYVNLVPGVIDTARRAFMVDGVTCFSCDNSVGPGTTFPVLASQIQPEYSEEARKAKYSGTVILNIEVDPSGRVVDLKVVRSLGMGLDEKAVQAVQQWAFKPGTKDGKPVAVEAQVEVHFALL
jgi:TonB family protein